MVIVEFHLTCIDYNTIYTYKHTHTLTHTRTHTITRDMFTKYCDVRMNVMYVSTYILLAL